MKAKRATKRLLILTLALAMVMTNMVFTTNVFAADAYSYIEATTLDRTASYPGQGTDLQFMANRIGSIWPQGVLVYRKVNFGDESPLTVEATAGARAGHAQTVKIMIDSPSSDPIALVPITQIEFAVPETNSAPLLRKVTGVHDVYITTVESTMNFYGFQFFGEREEEVVYSEYSTESVYNDVTDEGLKRDIDVLKQLGMLGYEGELFNANMPVTRGEFAKSVYGFFKDTTGVEENIDDSALYEKVKFSDVQGDNPNAEAINYLASRGIINGIEKDVFSPTGFITQIDAVVVLVRALGYQKMAEEEGGYPNGYLRIASKKKLVSTSLVGDDLLRRDELVYILRDAIDADYLVPEGVVNEYVTYDTLDSILCDTRDIYHSEGVIVGDSYSLRGVPKTPLKKNEIEIDGTVYKTGAAATGGLLGVECEFYYQLKDGVRTIKAIVPSSATEITTIKSVENDIHTINSKKIEYTPYDDDDKTETIELTNNTYIIYNGVAAEQKLENVLDNPTNFVGEIQVVENGDNSQTVIIKEHADYVIQALSTDNLSFVGANGKGAVEWTGDDYVFITDIEGNLTEARKLKVGNLLTVYESKNIDGKKLIRAFASEKTVTGRVSQTEGNFIYLDDVKYPVSNNYIPMNNEAKPALGQESTFYLNIYGEIVKATTKDPSAWQTGLFMGYNATETGFDKNLEIKVMTMDAKTVIYKVAKRITADGYKVDNYTDFINGAEGSFGGIANIAKEDAIRFRLNSAGELFAIDTCLPRGTKDHNDTIVQLISAADAHRFFASSQLMMNNTTAQFHCFVNKATAKCIYFNGVAGRTDREERAQVGLVSAVLTASDARNYAVYSTTGSKTEGDLVVHKDAIFDKYTSNKDAFVFESFGEGVNANGDPVTLFNGWQGGAKVTYTLDLTGTHDIIDDNAAASNRSYSVNKLFDAMPGDIFLLRTYTDGTIYRGQTLFLQGGAAVTDDYRSNMGSPISLAEPRYKGSAEPHTQRVIGKVSEKHEGYVTIDINIDDTMVEYIVPLTGTVCLVDKREADGKFMVEKAEISHISVGDYVYVNYNGGQVTAIVICRYMND